MSNPLRLHFVSIDSATHDERDFYNQSLTTSNQDVVVCDKPADADWILLTDFSVPEQFGLVRKHPTVIEFPRKSIIVTECDQPVEILPGRYSSGLHSCSISPFVDGWYYPYLNERFPNQQILLSQDTSPVEKNHLAAFLGYPSHIIRHRLATMFAHYPDMDIIVTKGYHHFEENDDLDSEAAQKLYVDALQKSHFSICPRGRGPSTMRLFDSMRFGVPPVIISDEWTQPSLVDWESCSLRIKEKHLGELHKILLQHKDSSREMGQNAKKIFQQHFAAECLGKTLRNALDHLSNSLASPPDLSSWFIFRTRVSRHIVFKTAFYKAVLYNRIHKRRRTATKG
jgi:hypothetical protein